MYLFVGIWAATELYVLLWAVFGSFQVDGGSSTRTRSGCPRRWTSRRTTPTSPAAGNFTSLSARSSSTPRSWCSVPFAVILLISIPAGYAISKKSRLNTAVFYLMLAMIAIPPAALLIPEVFLIRDLGLLNNFVGLILPYIAFNIPFSIVLSRAFFRSFPKDLEEAGRIDGLGELGSSGG